MPCRGPEPHEQFNEALHDLNRLTISFCKLGMAAYRFIKYAADHDQDTEELAKSLEDWYHHRRTDKDRVRAQLDGKLRDIRGRQARIRQLGGMPGKKLDKDLKKVEGQIRTLIAMDYDEDYESVL
jgi:hypothetical protein